MEDKSIITRNDEFGLYIHIPFCRAICYYCDFYKTAGFNTELVSDYFNALVAHLKLWLQSGHLPKKPWSSVFVGGGTPSLFLKEYEPLFRLISDHLTSDCEITLESNVDDITIANLQGWRSAGFNRLSMGVQSLNDAHLKFLTRRHSATKAIEAITLARGSFEKVNVDMIFGMPEHKPEEWSRDLTELISLGIGHLSLYSLTYEKRTPLTKFLEKGRFVPLNEDDEAELYALARDLLGSYKYIHEEVSNWALTSKSCRHNWLYWQDYPYLGVGAAAHSYLPNSETQGIRFSYPQSAAAFIKSTPKKISPLLPDMILECGSTIDERDLEAWVLETISCSLRTNRGVDTAYVFAKTGLQFKPTPLVTQGLANGSLFWQGKHLVLDVGQWFCESSWSLAVASSFSF